MQIVSEVEKTRGGPTPGRWDLPGSIARWSLHHHPDDRRAGREGLLPCGGRYRGRLGPENEWIETENKGMAMMRAIEAAGGYR